MTAPDDRAASRPAVEARIGSGDCVFDGRDAELLRAIDAHGSLNGATDDLGRSFAHAQRRIVELEEAFGTLVERRRGGSGGGGSELTADARELLAEYDRLQAEFAGLTDAEWTVLPGTVVARDGELGTVETDVGQVRALVPPDADGVEVAVRADSVTLNAPDETPEPEATSARNRFHGTVRDVDLGESVAVVTVAVEPVAFKALVTRASIEKLGLEPGVAVVASFKATATRAVPERT
ncbi:TOBE domain-containing protein [Halobacteriaceae archaeon GCM10025711]